MYRIRLGFLAIVTTLCVVSTTGKLSAQHATLPPKSYIRMLLKESDAVLAIAIEKVTLDSCKSCTSTGKLYVIECRILKKYVDKSGSLKVTASLTYTTAADTSVYGNGHVIVFLNKTPAHPLEMNKRIPWHARQATEFRFSAAVEKTILANRKTYH